MSQRTHTHLIIFTILLFLRIVCPGFYQEKCILASSQSLLMYDYKETSVYDKCVPTDRSTTSSIKNTWLIPIPNTIKQMNNNNKSPQSNPFKIKFQTWCSATIIPIWIHPGRFSKCKKKTKQNEKCITEVDTQRGKKYRICWWHKIPNLCLTRVSKLLREYKNKWWCGREDTHIDSFSLREGI